MGKEFKINFLYVFVNKKIMFVVSSSCLLISLILLDQIWWTTCVRCKSVRDFANLFFWNILASNASTISLPYFINSRFQWRSVNIRKEKQTIRLVRVDFNPELLRSCWERSQYLLHFYLVVGYLIKVIGKFIRTKGLRIRIPKLLGVSLWLIKNCKICSNLASLRCWTFHWQKEIPLGPSGSVRSSGPGFRVIPPDSIKIPTKKKATFKSLIILIIFILLFKIAFDDFLSKGFCVWVGLWVVVLQSK